MDKVISRDQALDAVKNGMTLMIGGFLAVGTPETLIDRLLQKGTDRLTVIANDTGTPEKGIGKQKAEASHSIPYRHQSRDGPADE